MSAQTSLPTIIQETETAGSYTYSGTWSWNGQGYSATWNNRAAATLTVKNFAPSSVEIIRTDLSNTTSEGLTATYTGQISDTSDSIVNGTVTWNWPGHSGYPATGKWTAEWKRAPNITDTSSTAAVPQPGSGNSPPSIFSPGGASTRDFTDRASFNTAVGGPTRTVGFSAPHDVIGFSGSRTLVVSGLTFSTSTPGVTINVTRNDIYGPNYHYPADFIINSVVGQSSSSAPNNDLTITLPCPVLAIGLDFGGHGTERPGTATMTLSNGHGFSQEPLPTSGKTTFAGFVSSVPITSLTLNTVGDSWVVLDVVVADCYVPTTPTPTPSPTPSPTPAPAFRQAVWKEMSNLSGSGSEVFTDDCTVGPAKPMDKGVPATPLNTILGYYPEAPRLNLVVDQDGHWIPLDMTFTLTSTFFHFGGMFFPDLSNPQTSYHLKLSQEGILAISETGSGNSFAPTGSFYHQLQGNATWNATQIIDLNSGKDTVTFQASLKAQYTGGAQPGTGKPLGVATTCDINSHYSGMFSAVDTFVFIISPYQAPTSPLTIYLGGAGMEGPYIPDQVKALQEVGVKNVAAGKFTSGHALDVLYVLTLRQRQRYNTVEQSALPGSPPLIIGETDWSLGVLGISDGAQTPLNFIGYSYGSLIAAQCAAYYADKGRKVGMVVLIGSPISQVFLDELKSNKNISSVVVVNLKDDPIYAGIPALTYPEDGEIIKFEEALNSGMGHMYYTPDTPIGQQRRRDLAKMLWGQGLR